MRLRGDQGLAAGRGVGVAGGRGVQVVRDGRARAQRLRRAPERCSLEQGERLWELRDRSG
jgi:hypothetical protein